MCIKKGFEVKDKNNFMTLMCKNRAIASDIKQKKRYMEISFRIFSDTALINIIITDISSDVRKYQYE